MKQDSSFQKNEKNIFFSFSGKITSKLSFFITRHLKIVLDYSEKVFYFWNAKNSEVIR